MAKVNSVLGPIDTNDLGFTLMHEHILVMNWDMRQAVPGWFDRKEFIQHAVKEVQSAKERGVKTMVDLTPINLGRDISVIKEVAEKAEMQIIAATGYYWFEHPMYQWREVEELVDFLIRDITDGIQGTDVKAGIIKCATDQPGVTDINKKLLQAAARMHRATGVPISTHSDVHTHTGYKQQDVFEEEGVDLKRVVIGHCGDSEDAGHLESIMKRGSLIGMDRFGIDMLLPTPQRVSVIAELCRRGYAEQMVLAHDAACHIDWFPKGMVEATVPNWNFRHISDDVIPALRKEGVTEAQIEAMTVGNPRRVFENHGAY
ncbi:MAG: phosphotriesterase-related protein [Deltaproteobacteria bacterium]|nr:phosphotriesterase-related protein [Deltaproteobacteria bacterium]